MSRYPSNTDHYKRRSGKGRRHGRGYGTTCWRQRNPNVYGYNHSYGDNRYEYDAHLPFEGSWIDEDVMRWLQSDNRSWTNQRIGNNWQHQNRTHHGANSFPSLRSVQYINSAGSSQNNCGTLKMNNANVSSGSENINDKPVSPEQQQPPPPGSEEARLEAVANTTDKLRHYLLTNRTESSEDLQTLLSDSNSTADPNSINESSKNANLDIPVPQPDLPPSPTDWQKMCMSSGPKSPTTSELVDDDDVVFVAKPTAETVSIYSDDSIDGDVSVISHKIKTENSVASLSSSELITDTVSNKTCSNLQDSSGNSKEKPNNLPPDSAPLRPILLPSAENDNPVGSLKQNVVRQLLKMGSASIKDIVNNPTSRKFQYALKHLVREHKVAWTRQLRALAETRIQNRNREIINHEHLLDPDIAVNISNLPQEFIEQLGDLLKMDLFDTADFQEANTDDAEQGLRDLELLCSQVTQEAEKAFHASRNSNQEILFGENVTGQIDPLQENNINLTQNDIVIVPNIKPEKVNSDLHLNPPDNTDNISKYSESSTSQTYEVLNSECPNLEKIAESQIDSSEAEETPLKDNQLNQFQPIDTGGLERCSPIVKDLVFDNDKPSNSLEALNSGIPTNIETEFIINEIPNSVDKDKEDYILNSVENSKLQDEGSCSRLKTEKIVNEEVGEIGIVNNTNCTDKALDITSQDYDKSHLISVDNVLRVNSPILNETEIGKQLGDSRNNCKPEETSGNMAHSSAGDNTGQLASSQEKSDFHSVISSKRICTPAAKKCYNFNSLGVSVCTQTESSSRKFDASEIISELEKVYHLPGHLIAVLKEYLEPDKPNVSKPQSETSVPSALPLICVSKSLFNKLDSNGTSNTYLPPSRFQQRSLPRKSTASGDSHSDEVINKETSQVGNQSVHTDNQVELNIEMNPDDSNLPQKGSSISSCTNISNDERTYLKMLDIDSKIHQLMGMKIDLYKQLHLSFISKRGNSLSSRTISYGDISNLQGESSSNIVKECGEITPFSELENLLTSDAQISRTIPSHRIDTANKTMPAVMELIPNNDKESDYPICSSSHINKIMEGRKGISMNSNLPKTYQNNQVNQCSAEMEKVVNSSSPSSIQSFKNSNSGKTTKKQNKKGRNKKCALKSVTSSPGQYEPVSQTILGETCTGINVDNSDRNESPGSRKRAKISTRELQSLGCLLNGANDCSTVKIKIEAPDSDVETNNLGRTRRRRYSLLDEKLLENQVYNTDTNMPNVDRKRKSIAICSSEVIDNPYLKKIKSESPYLPETLKETEKMHGPTNMYYEEEPRVGCVYNEESQQNNNANKLCQLPVSVASKAAVEINATPIIDKPIESASNEDIPSVSKLESTIIPCANVTNIDVLSESCCSSKNKEESHHSNANIYCPPTVKYLSKMRKCSVVLEKLSKAFLSKTLTTACFEGRSENITTLSAEPVALENVNSIKPFAISDDKDEDTNSVSSVSGGGTPRRLCGPDDGGEVEVRNRLVGHKGSILDLQCIGRLVLAACEDGFVYCYSLKSGRLKRTLHCSESAVTCLCISDSASLGLKFIFCGSLDGYLRCFTFETGDAVNEPIYVGSGIQCIDHNWGNIYIGTKDGSVKVFNCKKFEILTNYFECSKESIFTVRTTKEGPRKVMLIGSRSQPVIVRDSATGLYLRSVTQESNFTVYSIVLDSSLVYCGTSIGTIPVYNFTNGEEVCKFNAGTGVVCMKIYNDLLFAGCYDGFIYIFSIQGKNLITKVSGSGKMILSMEISKNRIICSSKDMKLEVWNFPAEVRKYLKDTKHR